MKRTVLALVLMVIVFLSITTLFVHNQISSLQNEVSALQLQNGVLQDQNIDLQEQVNNLQLQNREKQDRLTDFTYELAKARYVDAEITDFLWIGGFHPIGGLLLEHPINVTVQNNDSVPLSGLKITVRFANENTSAEIGYVYGVTIDRLNAGEKREMYMGGPWTALSTSLSDAACIVTLTAGAIVLDEVTYDLS